MGFAGNNDPTYVIPTEIALKPESKGGSIAGKRGIEDMDFFIGDEARAHSNTYNLQSPVRQGQVDNWDLMEKFHQSCIFEYLRLEPEDHYFLLVNHP